MPFYKDPMSYGNLIVEFKIDFPKKNFFSKDKIEKLSEILAPKRKGHVTEKRDPKTNKILEDFREADLNQSASGGQ